MTVIDASGRFLDRSGRDIEVTVSIIVKIKPAFIWAVIKCLVYRKDLRITHTYTERGNEQN